MSTAVNYKLTAVQVKMNVKGTFRKRREGELGN